MEYKFRAWDDVAKEWLFTGRANDGFSLTGEMVLMGEWSSVINRFHLQQDDRKPGDLKITQYTGLKDKNGVEIYEGDIIRVDEFFFDGYSGETSTGSAGEVLFAPLQSEVVFVDGGFCAKELEIPIGCCNIEDCYIIGNIYQNADLLQ